MFGPFPADGSIAEIKAAWPDADWHDADVSEHTGRVFDARSRKTREIWGHEFIVSAHEEHYYRSLAIRATLAVSGAAACEASALSWLGAVENDVGPFSPDVVLSVDPATGIPPSSLARHHEVLRFGLTSEATLLAVGRKGKLISWRRSGAAPEKFRMVAKRDLDAGAVVADVRYDGGESPLCTYRLSATRSDPVPPPVEIAFDETKLIRKPTVGDRHSFMSKLKESLPEGLSAEAVCEIDRGDGSARRCEPIGLPAGGDSYAATAMKALAQQFAFDMTGVDRDDPVPMRVRIPLSLSPADIRPTDFLDAPRMPPDRLSVVRRMRYEYPKDPMWKGVEGRVRLLCQVQTDGSVVCALLEAAAGTFQEAFVQAAMKAASRNVYGPVLKDGSPSAGAVVETLVEFRIE